MNDTVIVKGTNRSWGMTFNLVNDLIRIHGDKNAALIIGQSIIDAINDMDHYPVREKIPDEDKAIDYTKHLKF
jgi:hypothetical protein